MKIICRVLDRRFIVMVLGSLLLAGNAAVGSDVKKPEAAEIHTSIADVGAVADGTTLNTDKIQSAIDQLATKGGGTVVIPKGVFLTGALFLKPGVNLHIEKDGV